MPIEAFLASATLIGVMGIDSPIVVYAAPARRNRHANPYNYLLSEALSAQGCDVCELDRRNGLFGHPDVVHIHWPQTRAKGPILKALQISGELALRLAIQRARGAAIIWTAHNIHAHDQNNPALERALMGCVTRLISGAVYLSATSRDMAEARYPALRRKPHAIIPHGIYGAVFDSEKDRSAARAHFSIPPSERVVSFLGDILPYKGLDVLTKAVMKLKPSELFLLVAGTFPADDSYAQEIRAGISKLQVLGHKVRFTERRLSNSEMVDAIRASDVVALPYKAAANSGLAILAIEHGARLLTTDHAVFRELRDEVGSDRITIAGPDFDADAVRTALQGKKGGAQDRIDTFLQARSWTSIAAQTVAFYRRCGAKPKATTTVEWRPGQSTP